MLVLHSNCGWVREADRKRKKAKKPKKRVTKKQRKVRKGVALTWVLTRPTLPSF